MDPQGPLAAARPVVIICTRDRAKSEPFYRDVLGLRMTGSDDFAAVFDVGGAPLRLSTVADWKPHEHTIFGFAVDDIKAVVAALKKKGVSFTIYPGFGQDDDGVWTTPDKSVRVAWFSDPDGNNLSLAQFG
jgi:catechol 2,3-dioxygenase-like lactoylglutathione lyase family enzyme